MRGDWGALSLQEGFTCADDEPLPMAFWPLNVCADVVDAAAACSTAIDATMPGTLRGYFLDDALLALADAEELLVDHRLSAAVDALFTALGLLSDAIDATEGSPVADPAARALELATHAVAAASAL
jgi:hypothetical protein